jgi:hypothetical protein
MDEQKAHDLIEEAAKPWLAKGYEPTDSEPGEWLTLTKGTETVTLYVMEDTIVTERSS